ncbi:MAG: methylated-DNA--[protein]-cysteine S-methyltransferase [Bacteroidia bacterium]|nr:methylated-DNA--[protein]-cysteine S-methyltransferase [Bacteroidia bacterium]
MDEDIVAKTYYDTPIGTLEIKASELGIRSLCFIDYPTYEQNPTQENLLALIEQLDEYFQGKRSRFNVFLDFQGTEFQRRVWRELMEIPLGGTKTYLEVAKEIKSPKAVRAVGSACGSNKLWLLVPCHRVIGSDGKLTGYAGGLKRKRWLLEHEWGILYGKQKTLF